MIKVTIQHKAVEDRYTSDASYLVDTDSHDVAVVTAVRAFMVEKPNNVISYLNANTETSVLQPYQYS